MSPTTDEIRKEVDEVVAAISKIITRFKKEGVGYMQLIASMPDFLEILGTGQYFAVLTKEEKAKFGGEVFDALTGSDEHAVLRNVGPISAEQTEKFLDASKEIVVDLISKRLESRAG